MEPTTDPAVPTASELPIDPGALNANTLDANTLDANALPDGTALDPSAVLDPSATGGIGDALTTQAHEITVSGLFLQADPIVKAVMILLILASVVTWAVAIEKSLRLRRLRRETAAFEAGVAARKGAAIAGELQGMPRAAVDAGLVEWRELEAEDAGERRMRAEQAMRLSVTENLREVEKGLPFLATVGSAAPFIGLFGTVWGILNSFTAIANSQDTSLAVVAPGIAEALFATAIGLVAAIPAVMWYNAFATQLGRLGARLSTAIARLANQLGRKRVAAGDLRRAAE
ncbi:MotA/TolQ/ExbB proton channel family protein [Zavarzinia compransoris]|uniref:MotA/TolQ/ExbB proton channel family protein n=1 Tax=Zavarzinia marina TaxID=2911065 RepID=UPI001F37569D|nr:MotA/TolQ/ExbB proton channel family protein [Zavarzinia marina]MCF4166765.1 MotA/TolQ/ExbB proton channel family protein [Zavarzinia marina]